MKRIFISYRREDSAIFTGRLYDRLSSYYGVDFAFLDIDSINPGEDFQTSLETNIKQCTLFLAIIGMKWEGPLLDGGRRLDGPRDFVRREVEAAFSSEKKVIPVYIGERAELQEHELPSTLSKKLATCQACRIDAEGPDFKGHVARLCQAIDVVLFPSLVARVRHVLALFVRRNYKTLVILALSAIVLFASRDTVGRWLLTTNGINAALEAADASAFANGTDGRYQVVRGISNRTRLVSETSMVDTLNSTNETFDVFALAGTVLYVNDEAMKSALRRGVKFRILLLDHGKDNMVNIEEYYRQCGDKSFGISYNIDNARQGTIAFTKLKEFVVDPASQTKGTLEVHWWRGAFLNSFWIRDGGSETRALGHIEVTFAGDTTENPCLRFGTLSPEITASLQKRFDVMWAKSSPKEPVY